jgi:hypothetical protein
MYTKLCTQLNDWFQAGNMVGVDTKTFRRVLLEECQHAFEKYLVPFKASSTDSELAFEEELKHKTKMLGNITFVGKLIVAGILANKLVPMICDTLLDDCTAANVECTVTFLTVIGPACDRPEWPQHAYLKTTYIRLMDVGQRKNLGRVRYLILNLLDERKQRQKAAKEEASRASK